MAQAGVPISPSSSKRSRSRDSTRSTPTSSSLNTPAAHTPFITPAVSTHSLTLSSSTPGTPNNGDQSIQDATPYPPFLLSSRVDINGKWDDLENAQGDREDASMRPNASEGPDRWARCNGKEYASRNRYINVDPYQANRVRLDVPEGQFDYINASPITLATTKSGTVLKYIATQVSILTF